MSVVRRSGKWCIRYYGPDGRQRWETIGPNRKEAETVLHQRLYEVRSSHYPILQRRRQLTFAAFADEWGERHVGPKASSVKRYREWLRYQLLPVFGARVLSGITVASVEQFKADAIRAGLAPKTVNGAIGLLKQMLAAAAEWGYLPASPIAKVKKMRVPRRALPLWTLAEIRRALLHAPEAWRDIWLVAVFTGLRPGELQAMAWTEQNWPDFTSNVIHITAAYEARSKVLGAPKTDRAVRDIDMVPSVRRVLEAAPRRTAGGIVFPRPTGGMFSRDTMHDAWYRTIDAAGVRRIRPYDLRHTYASLLIAAGKNPLYIARQMGHYSAGFTFETYGHLIEALPKRQVEWIDELVFPEGWDAALNLHLSGALSGATVCSDVRKRQRLERPSDVASGDSMQSGATECVVPPARFELALPA